MSEAKWYQKLRFWLWEKRVKISAVIYAVVFMIAGALFVWNIIYAKSEESNTNVLTAIAGWVSFFATVGIGIITLVQGKWYSEDNEYSIKEMKRCVDRIENCVNKIDDSLWRQNSPAVFSKKHDPMTLQFVNMNEKEYEKYSYATDDDVHFEITPTGKSTACICTRIIEFPIYNLSSYAIQSIECVRIHLSYGGSCTIYENQADILQGFMYSNEKKKCIIEVLDSEPIDTSGNDSLFMRFEIVMMDVRGNTYFALWDVGCTAMKYNKKSKKHVGNIDSVEYHIKRGQKSDYPLDFDELFKDEIL